jgi:hypothetical protein
MQLVVATLFSIASFAREKHIPRNMQSQTEPVHTLKMFNRGPILFQWPVTITAITPKCSFDSFCVPWICDTQFE